MEGWGGGGERGLTSSQTLLGKGVGGGVECLHARTHARLTHACTRIQTHRHTHKHMHTCMHTRTHAHMHTHLLSSSAQGMGAHWRPSLPLRSRCVRLRCRGGHSAKAVMLPPAPAVPAWQRSPADLRTRRPSLHRWLSTIKQSHMRSTAAAGREEGRGAQCEGGVTGWPNALTHPAGSSRQ